MNTIYSPPKINSFHDAIRYDPVVHSYLRLAEYDENDTETLKQIIVDLVNQKNDIMRQLALEIAGKPSPFILKSR